jgi:hypothetical protein
MGRLTDAFVRRNAGHLANIAMDSSVITGRVRPGVTIQAGDLVAIDGAGNLYVPDVGVDCVGRVIAWVD